MNASEKLRCVVTWLSAIYIANCLAVSTAVFKPSGVTAPIRICVSMLPIAD